MSSPKRSSSTELRLDARVKELFQLSWGKARQAIETGKVFVDGERVLDPGAPAGAASSIELRMNAPRPDKTRPSSDKAASPTRPPEIVYSDSQLVVVDKPPGISTVPFEKGETGSLIQNLEFSLKIPKLSVVHRLDKETTGLVVFARTREAETHLANQFRFHTVDRRYLALAHGSVRDQTIRSWLLENRGDGLRGSIPAGSRIPREAAREAVTHVRALHRFSGMTLIECRLETGRTHQIRIHLSEAGHPLVGEHLYIREFQGPRIDAPRFFLHAAELGIEHPTKRTRMSWWRLPPRDFLGRLPPESLQGISAPLLKSSV